MAQRRAAMSQNDSTSHHPVMSLDINGKAVRISAPVNGGAELTVHLDIESKNRPRRRRHSTIDTTAATAAQGQGNNNNHGILG